VIPRETVAFVIALGLGILWGALSLLLWSADERVPGLVIAPLWIVAASVFLVVASARGTSRE